MAEEQGPFDRILQSDPPQRRDRAATIIVGLTVFLGLLLLVLVLPPISILDGGGDGDDGFGTISTVIQDDLPPPPAGLEAVSALLDVSATEPVAGSDRPRLTVDLSTQVTEGERLALYTYRDGKWRLLGDAIGVANGSAAQGEVPFLPDNVAVFRTVEQVQTVLGSLPLNAELDPLAAGVLSAINITGFAPLPDGSISGGPITNDTQLDAAPTVSALSPAEKQALDAILASPELRAAHVDALSALAREGGSGGVDLDYQAIDPARQEAFVALIQELSTRLRADGLGLTIALPLPVQQDAGWNTMGFDWEALVPLVDAIKLAPEPAQDLYYPRIEEALAYLVPRVGSSKLLLPVSPLSHERGVDGLRSMTLTEALALASTPATQQDAPVAPGATVVALAQNLAPEMGASALRWDDSARAIVFTYTGAGGERTVWLANIFSEAFKLDLARRYHLRGVVIENVSRDTADANIWPAVQRYAQTGEVELVKPNGGLLQPRWTVSAGALDSDGVGASVSWHAPAESGTYTLTLIVSDGVVRVGQELQVPVQPVSARRPVSP